MITVGSHRASTSGSLEELRVGSKDPVAPLAWKGVDCKDVPVKDDRLGGPCFWWCILVWQLPFAVAPTIPTNHQCMQTANPRNKRAPFHQNLVLLVSAANDSNSNNWPEMASITPAWWQLGAVWNYLGPPWDWLGPHLGGSWWQTLSHYLLMFRALSWHCFGGYLGSFCLFLIPSWNIGDYFGRISAISSNGQLA